MVSQDIGCGCHSNLGNDRDVECSIYSLDIVHCDLILYLSPVEDESYFFLLFLLLQNEDRNPFGTFARRLSRQRDLTLTEEQLTRNQTVCGVPLPSVEMKVVDPEDFSKELPWDGESVGELIVRGTSTCDSYFNVSEEVMAKKFYNGWLITGDLAARTESGQLVIKDRSKDMIKSGGEWISSVDLENQIMGIQGVAAACVGMDSVRIYIYIYFVSYLESDYDL